MRFSFKPDNTSEVQQWTLQDSWLVCSDKAIEIDLRQVKKVKFSTSSSIVLPLGTLVPPYPVVNRFAYRSYISSDNYFILKTAKYACCIRCKTKGRSALHDLRSYFSLLSAVTAKLKTHTPCIRIRHISDRSGVAKDEWGRRENLPLLIHWLGKAALIGFVYVIPIVTFTAVALSMRGPYLIISFFLFLLVYELCSMLVNTYRKRSKTLYPKNMSLEMFERCLTKTFEFYVDNQIDIQDTAGKT